MRCAYCKYNDGLVYTSIPQKYKCTITNEFHLAFDDCNVEFAPIKRGKWIDNEFGSYCSNCGLYAYRSNGIPWKSDYCPNCGARMNSKE